jgi:hypothetical protein
MYLLYRFQVEHDHSSGNTAALVHSSLIKGRVALQKVSTKAPTDLDDSAKHRSNLPSLEPFPSALRFPQFEIPFAIDLSYCIISMAKTSNIHFTISNISKVLLDRENSEDLRPRTTRSPIASLSRAWITSQCSSDGVLKFFNCSKIVKALLSYMPIIVSVH